jgi:hypothetical protein
MGIRTVPLPTFHVLIGSAQVEKPRIAQVAFIATDNDNFMDARKGTLGQIGGLTAAPQYDAPI